MSEHKEAIAQYHQQYRKENIAIIQQKKREYYEKIRRIFWTKIVQIVINILSKNARTVVK